MTTGLEETYNSTEFSFLISLREELMKGNENAVCEWSIFIASYSAAKKFENY